MSTADQHTINKKRLGSRLSGSHPESMSVDHPKPSRRSVLVGFTALLSGCGMSPLPDSGGSASSNTTPSTQGSPAGSEIVTSEPACDETDADQLVTVTPHGVVFVVENRPDAQDLRDTIVADEKKGTEADDIRLVPFSDSDQVAVELDETEFAAYTEFQNETGVISVRKGRSLPTVVELATSYRAQILKSNAISPSQSSVRYVRPEPPSPLRFTLALAGVGDTSVLERLVTFEIRVAGPEGERTVLTSTDIRTPSTSTEEGLTRIMMTIAEPARERFLQALRDAGAFSSASDSPIRVYSNGEKIVELGLSRNLINSMQAGEWQGNFAIQVTSQQTASELATALGLVSTAIKTTTTIEICN